MTIASSDFFDAIGLNTSGVALTLEESNAIITDSNFESLEALSGPAIYSYHALESGFSKSLKIVNTNFLSNTASIIGGAVYTQDVDFEIIDSFI